MQYSKITFPGSQGNLAARLDMPASRPRGYALFAHCFTCSKDIFAASRIAEGLSNLGIATFRFDFTGLGSSEGEFENTNFTSNVEDLLHAADYMRQELSAPTLLIGHSLGGAAILAAAGQIPEAEAVATIGAPYDPGHVGHHFEDKRSEIEAEGVAEVKLAGRSFRVKKQFLDDISSQNQKERIASLRKPLAIFHAPLDNTVSVDNAADIFVTAKHPKSFISLDQADHLLTRREDAIYVARTLAAWASPYMPGLANVPEPVIKARGSETVVSETKMGKFQQIVSTRGHDFLADEPLDFGGDNTGPGPYDFLLAALGACTSITIRMYAERKGIPLERVSIRMNHAKQHVDDCAQCLAEGKSMKLDVIDKELILEGPLDEEQKAKLTAIADKCPVHRTLHNEVIIKTQVTG